MTNPTNIPPIKIQTRKHHLSCVERPIDADYAQNLWYIVSGAIECGGLGGDSWGWQCHPVETWKPYNEAKDEQYTANYPFVSMQMVNREDDETMSEYIRVDAQWLHNKVVKFVNDKKMPEHLRKHYAELLVTRKIPDDHDAVTCDALMQYAFVNEIVFG
jgi:hypothetical protein